MLRHLLSLSRVTFAFGIGLGAVGCSGPESEVQTSADQALGWPLGSRIVVVDRSTDGADGVCGRGAPAGACNLRAAVAEALATRGPGQIQLDVDSVLTEGEIVVSPVLDPALGAVSISSRGEPKTIASGKPGARLFRVTENARLGLTGAVVRGFTLATGESGAAIANAGQVTLQNVLVKDNAVTCSATGAMNANTWCSGGAVVSSGTLTLRAGTRFEGNRVAASAGAAAYTGAIAFGGAVASTGTLAVEGAVIFAGNTVTAAAHSGFHASMPFGGAQASSAGGAVYAPSGTARLGGATFSANAAEADASVARTEAGIAATASSRGGAVYAGDQVLADVGGASFEANLANEGPDTFVAPPTSL